MKTDLAVVGDAALPMPLSEGQARVLDRRIRLASVRVADEQANLMDLLEEAARGQIHVALKYPSWPAYVKEAVTITPADESERKALVALMSGKGMSQRAIADVVGVNQATVSRDLSEAGDANASAETTTGVDGKTYKRPVKQDVIDAEVVEIGDGKAEEEEEPEPEPRTAIDVIADFGENVDYLMPAVQAFTDQLIDDAELFPKARKRLAKSYLNPLQEMLADLQRVVDELMEA